MMIDRLTDFLLSMRKDVFCPVAKGYEKVAQYNQEYSVKLFEMSTKINLQGLKVLDVGFGDGSMLEYFKSQGAIPTGIGLDEECHREYLDKGFDVRLMDQSFMDFEDDTFDLLWSRHCLEHSIFPFYTLHEYKRVMKPGAIAFIELPGPDNDNDENYFDDWNHYSVMTKNMWKSLMKRTEFEIMDYVHLALQPAEANEKRACMCQYIFILRKPL